MIQIEDERTNNLTTGELWRERLKHLRTRARSIALRIFPFASGVLAALLALMVYRAIFPGPHQLTLNEVNDSVAQALASATPPPAFSARVFQVIQPSLVLILTESPAKNHEEGKGLGSGVIVNLDGAILTSLHVVEDADDIQVIFADGTKSRAQVIGSQPENDIAVLMPEQPPAQIVPAILGNPNAMHVGDEGFVVGNPFGLYSSMSAGVISGFNRSFEPTGGDGKDRKLEGLIQIDAAVNPGNSGGPLLNRNGEVVGIVVGILNPTDESFFVGIGFAVPIDVAGGAAGLPPY